MGGASGAEEAISGIAQAWNDVSSVVEGGIEGGKKDRDVGMAKVEMLHSGLRTDEGEHSQSGRAE